MNNKTKTLARVPRPATRLQKALALLRGATVVLAEPVTEDDSGALLASGEWIALSFKLADGEELSLIVAADDEGNGPGALLGLWGFARKRGIL